jgi:hypothetical protein
VQPDERALFERAIGRVTEQAANANAIVDEAMAAGLENVKIRHTEKLGVKGDLERAHGTAIPS